MPKIVWMNFARRYRIALGNPADLIFADGMHRLVAFHPSACTLDRAESEPRSDPLFDESMVLLDDNKVMFGSGSAVRVRRTL